MGEFTKTGVTAGASGMGVTMSQFEYNESDQPGELWMAPTYHVPPAEARELWKQAACAALGVIVVRQGAPGDVLAKDFAYSAALAADELVAEYGKRVAPPRVTWPASRAYHVAGDPADTREPEVRGQWTNASDERLDIIEVNECNAPVSLATIRFRACFNEIRRLTDALRRAESRGK